MGEYLGATWTAKRRRRLDAVEADDESDDSSAPPGSLAVLGGIADGRPSPSSQTPPAARTAGRPADEQYDLLLRGGHVIDATNNINAVRDVAIKDGKIAAVAAKIDPGRRR